MFYATEILATGCVDERTRKKKSLSSIAASGSPNAIANRLRKGASRLGIWACCIAEDLRERSLTLAKKYKNKRKKMQFSSLRPLRPRNYPARTVIVWIVKRTPSFLLLSDRNSPLSPITVTLYAHSTNEFYSWPFLFLRDTGIGVREICESRKLNGEELA